MRIGIRTLIGLAALVVVIAGCASNRSEPPGAVNNANNGGEPRVAAMERFDTEQEFVDYFSGQVTAQNDRFVQSDGSVGGSANSNASTGFDGLGAGNDAGSVSGEAPPQDGSGGQAAPVPGAPEGRDDDFSGTTVQEVGVDEADVVKTDGQYLYILSDGLLRIVDAVPADALQQVGEYAVEGYGQDMYLFNGRAVVITAADSYVGGPSPLSPVAGFEGGAADLYYFPGIYRPRVAVTVIDVSDPAAPALVTATRFDGSLSSSRMIDGVLHLVVANYPNYYGDILPLGAPDVDVAVRGMATTDILPNFEMEKSDGSRETGDVVTWEDLYRPVDPDGFGMALLISVDVRQPDTFQSQGIVSDPGLIYSSTEALYITDTNYSWTRNQSRTNTSLYKFAYRSGTAELVAAGSVEGRIINQYSMSEYQDHLRVAATIDGFTRADSQTTNRVYVLAQRDNALTTVGMVDDIAPGESLYAARFLGDKGYLVTFLQIDPLFTLDLSNPEQPRLVGELEVPGFSTFIQPISDTRLLTIGQDGAFGGVKLSIYDVSDFANPRVVADELLATDQNSYAYSEAQYNPKAFNYYASPTAGNLLALPVRIESYSGGTIGGGPFPVPPEDFDDVVDDGSGGVTLPPDDAGMFAPPQIDVFDGLYVYRITDAGFEQIGRVSTAIVPDIDGEGDEYPYYYYGYYSAYGRGVFIGDNVYAVTDRTVVAAPLSGLDTTLSRVDFPFDFGGGGGIGVVPPSDVIDIGNGGGTVGSGGSAGGMPGESVPPMRQ